MRHILMLGVVLLIAVPSCAQQVTRSPSETVLAADPCVLPTSRCGGLFLTEAFINGQGPYRLIVDTGAGITILDLRVGLELGAQRADNWSITGAEGDRNRAGGLVRIEELVAGCVAMHEFDALTADLEPFQGAFDGGFHGILGFPAFKDAQLVVDYPADEVRLTKEELGGASCVPLAPPYEGGMAWIDLDLDGRTVKTAIDTGSNGGLDVPSELKPAIVSGPALAGATIAVGSVETTEIVRYRGEITLGPVVVEQPLGELTDGWARIGERLMRDFVVRIDQRSRLVRFEPAPGVPARIRPAARRTTGFALFPRQDHAEVIHVGASCPVRDRLSVGDRVLSIDGLGMNGLACGGWSDLVERSEEVTLEIERDGERFSLVAPVMEIVP